MKIKIGAAISLGIIEIGLALYLTFWSKAFWSAVEKKELSSFTEQLVIFSGVALALCLVVSVASYLISLIAIEWRNILNEKALKSKYEVSNMEQRIQEDCRDYPTIMLNLGFGFIKSLVYILTFAITLCIEFSYVYLIILLTYATIFTLIIKKVATPLIKLNYDSQAAEATYRKYRTVENFEICVSIMLGLAQKTKKLNYFQTFYGQVGVIIPILVIAPQYFSGVVTFGMLMQGTRIMGTVLDNLSYSISSFGDINRLLSCRKRLQEMGVV